MKTRIEQFAVAILVAALLACGCGSPPDTEEGAASTATEPVISSEPLREAQAVPETTAPPAKEAPAQPSPALTIAPGPDVQEELQEALIEATPGSVIQLEEGTYSFVLGLSLDVDGVTLRGRGMDKTILDFKNQEAGSEGLFVTSDNVLLEDFAIVDTKGNGIKSQDANNIIYRRVRTEWTGGPKETNGAYGLYPVSSSNVLIEECVAIGGSDSGIYVGQSKNIIVRNCRAEFNVAGIEIENCHGADVYGNEATNNTGGLLVFDLPDLPQQRGHDIRLLNNKVYGNNTPNFAPQGNIVANVPAGTGVMVMANSKVEIFENDIRDHGTSNLLLVSYFSTLNEIKDPNYYPYVEGIYVHDNVFGPCGDAPGGTGGQLMASILGAPLPDIIWDGAVNEAKVQDGKVAQESGIYIRNNTKEGGELTFANLGGIAALSGTANPEVKRDLADHTGSLPPLAEIVIPGIG